MFILLHFVMWYTWFCNDTLYKHYGKMQTYKRVVVLHTYYISNYQLLVYHDVTVCNHAPGKRNVYNIQVMPD
jgi:hypothetical protein